MAHQRIILVPLFTLFALVTAGLLLCTSCITKWGLGRDILQVANALFFIISLVSFFIQNRGIQHTNPNVFVRSVMGGTFVKMAVVLIAFFVYIMVYKKQVSKPTIIAGMILYFLYLIIEVTSVLKLNRRTKNG